MTNTDNQNLAPVPGSFIPYDQWRNKFLRIVLWVACGLGIFLLGAIVPSTSTVELIVFGAAYLILVFVTILPLPYYIKAGTLIVIGYFIGIFTLVQFGPWSDSTIFFLATTIFAVLLFDNRIDRIMIVISTITLVSVGILDISGFNIISGENIPPLNSYDWLTYIVDFVVLAIASVWAINQLKIEFKTVSEQLQSTLIFVSNDRTELEQRVEERTANLIKKTDQLRAASFIARKTAETQDLYSLLNSVTVLIADQFGYYHSGIFLMSEAGDDVVLQAASSDGGKRMLEKGHSLQVGSQGIVGYTAAQKKPHIALDVGVDAFFFNNPDLPMTRSEVALPLLIGNKVLGVLDIQSDQPQAFRSDDIDVLQTLADQVAVAIEHTRRLDEAQAALIQVETLAAVRTREAWNQRLQDGGLAYTYTPLGLRSGGNSEESDLDVKIPITLRGQRIGSLSLTRKDGTPWNETDKDMISEVVHQTGLAIDSVRLVEEATQRAKQEQTVGELATRFSQTMDIDNLLQIAARELGQVADVAEVSVYIGNMPEQAPQKRLAKRSTG